MPGEVWGKLLRDVGRDDIGRLRRLRRPGHHLVDQAARIDAFNRRAEVGDPISLAGDDESTLSVAFRDTFRNAPSNTPPEAIADLIFQHAPREWERFKQLRRNAPRNAAPHIFVESFINIALDDIPSKKWADVRHLPVYVLAFVKSLRLNFDLFFDVANDHIWPAIAFLDRALPQLMARVLEIQMDPNVPSGTKTAVNRLARQIEDSAGALRRMPPLTRAQGNIAGVVAALRTARDGLRALLPGRVPFLQGIGIALEELDVAEALWRAGHRHLRQPLPP
jgi:hypothetical protein